MASRSPAKNRATETSPGTRPSDAAGPKAASDGQEPRAPSSANDRVTAIDWKKVAYDALTSRALDDVEEATNRNRANVPKDHVVLYQFSARGHEVAQAILGTFLTEPRDGVAAYYRSRPLLLALGLSLEDALASPLGRSGGFSDGRDIGVVCNMPNEGRPIVLPMAGDVGSQFTPAAGWAQSIAYYRDALGDSAWHRAIAVVTCGDAAVATNGFWSALTIATTLQLPLLFCVEDNGLGISVPGDFQTPNGNIAANLASFGNLMLRDGDGCDPQTTVHLLAECVDHVRAGSGPALVHLTLPRLASHSGPDNQRAYRTEAEIAADWARDPLPRLKAFLVPDVMSEQEWSDIERRVHTDVDVALTAARARPAPDPAGIRRFVYAEPLRPGDCAATGGMREDERAALGGEDAPAPGGARVLFAEALRRTLRTELARNPKVVVFGEDVGVKGGVHLVTEGLQKEFGATRVFDTSLSEEGIVGRAVGMAIAGLMPVAEIQFRKYADPAHEHLNNCGTLRWRTANRFCAPIVVRMPGGFGKDVGDPWHSVTGEVTWAHAVGWQVAFPSNAADAVGLLRSAMRGANPTIFFEHRALLMTSDGSSPYPGDDYILPFGKACVVRSGEGLTIVSWGAILHRVLAAVDAVGEKVDVIDLRTIAPWDRTAVLDSVRRTGRCLIVHEDTLTAGFGAEIAATVASDAFWQLDAPVQRIAIPDVPTPYHPSLMAAVVPSTETIAQGIRELLTT